MELQLYQDLVLVQQEENILGLIIQIKEKMLKNFLRFTPPLNEFRKNY